MATILDQIVEQKKAEVKRLYEQLDFDTLRRQAQPCTRSFYRALSAARKQGRPFLIAEFKRKSPSEGWINREADLSRQVLGYAASGASAVSVLTDTDFFGGSYADLQQAARVLNPEENPQAPLLLQKDFILDPIQIYLARLHGANIILLIAAILAPERLAMLRHTAEQLGMGVLVEVHDREELEKIKHLDFPVLGINSRDLRTFRTALNRVNVLARLAGSRYIIAESGIRDYRDTQIVRRADGFLIGTSLMKKHSGNEDRFALFQDRMLFKACGIRTADLLDQGIADFTGVNFSPVSKRRIDPELLENRNIPEHAVAVFYKNTGEEIREILARFPFRIVQLYAGDFEPELLRSLRQKIFLACRVREPADLEQLETYAADVDLFILDSAAPGSGTRIDTSLLLNFPYPFLLAGGLHAGNLETAAMLLNCIGADIASGIETDGCVDRGKMRAVAQRLQVLRATVPGESAVHSHLPG